MPRKILVEFTFDWDNEEETTDQGMIDGAFYGAGWDDLRDGISAKIVQQPSSSGVESAGVKQLLEDFLDYVGGNYTQHGTGDDVYWDREEGEDREMNYEGVVEDYLFDNPEPVAAPSLKEREIAFAEWIINENYKHYAGWWYKNGNNFANDPFSTGSLYDLYLESLNK